jgi:hypothetical protein
MFELVFWIFFASQTVVHEEQNGRGLGLVR